MWFVLNVVDSMMIQVQVSLCLVYEVFSFGVLKCICSTLLFIRSLLEASPFFKFLIIRFSRYDVI